MIIMIIIIIIKIPIDVAPTPIVRDVRAVSNSNAKSPYKRRIMTVITIITIMVVVIIIPMDITLSGIITDVREDIDLKA